MAEKSESKMTARGRDSKAKFIAAAREHMIETGSIDVTLVQLSQRSKLNGALVKYHFGNKDGLLTAVALKATQKNMRALGELVNAEMSARRKLEVHLSGLIKLYLRHPYINDLVNYLRRFGSEEQKTIITDEIFQPFLDYQETIIREGMDAGEFKEVDPELISLLLRGACDALINTRWKSEENFWAKEWPEAERVRYAVSATQLMLEGLVA